MSLFDQTSTDPVIAVDFNPVETNSIVSIGKNHLAFWSIENSSLSKKQGIFEVCIVFNSDWFFSFKSTVTSLSISHFLLMLTEIRKTQICPFDDIFGEWRFNYW